MLKPNESFIAIVPAAGVGSRMKADRPKQYLSIGGKTILEHTVEKLLRYPRISKVVIAVTEGDPYFSELAIAQHPDVIRVAGGKERADSVLSGLKYINRHFDSEWALVHDAARPCLLAADLDRLIDSCLSQQWGGLLASPVRDTMKRSNSQQQINHTVDRQFLWHALTPQMFKTQSLTEALNDALNHNVAITDEASALEYAGKQVALVQGSASNIKITQPEDLLLAEFYLSLECSE